MVDRRARWQLPRRPYLVLFGLSGAAVAVPLLDLYGKNPEVFVANRSSKVQIVLFGLLAALAVPVVATTILAVMSKVGRGAATVAYHIMVGLLTVAAALVISRQLVPDSTIGASALALSIVALVLFFLRRIETGLVWTSLLVPAALVLFFVLSPTSRLVTAAPPDKARDTSAIGVAAPIVVIQLDELPLASLLNEDGTINDSLFPQFARLADSATWYRNALSDSIATTQSVPSILSGRLSDGGASPTDIDHPDNLFTLLAGAYDMHVIEWVTDMCTGCEDYAGRAPARFASLLSDVGVVYGHLTLPSAARDDLPNIDNSWNAFLGQADNPNPGPVEVEGFPVPPAGVRSSWTGWMQRIINGIEAGAPPTVSYVHAEAPHIPWQINPSGTQYRPPDRQSEVDGVEGTGFWVPNPAYPRLGFQRHLYQLGFVDEMLGALFDKLEETGTWDDALIVVVADHGASFVAGQHRRWPYDDNRDDLYRIPLIIKYPGQDQGEIEDRTAFGIDVLPTIVDALDIDTDWEFDGRSLLSDLPEVRPHEPIHWCCSRAGADTDLRVLYAQARRNHDWIPDQTTWLGVASVGPAVDLVSSPLDDLAVERDPQMTWSLDQADSLASVDRTSGMVPTMMTGRLQLPPGVKGDDLLFSVNGVVAGAGFVIRDSADGGEIRGLLAEELVTNGENDVVILVPNPTGRGWMTGSATDLALQYLADDGHILDVHPEGDRRIFVDPVTTEGEDWRLSGWAADVGAKVPADRIYVFAGDVLVAAGPSTEDTPTLVDRYESDDLARAGFTFDLDVADLPADVERLMVIAEFGTQAVSNPAALHPGG